MDASPDFPRQSRVPVFNLPGVVTASIALLMAIHAARTLALPDDWDIRLFDALALLPVRWTLWIDPDRAQAVIDAAAKVEVPGYAEAVETYIRVFASDPEPKLWTFATYALLHGSWLHVIFNSVWLAAFGSPVARRCGAWRYGLIGLAGTVAGAALHVAIDPLSTAPLVGASAGVSALMAAAARFVFQPPAAGYGSQPWQLPPRRPPETLRELLRNRTAVTFLIIWLVTNLLFGLIALPFGAEGTSIAWDAHLGGFAAGFFLFPLLDPLSRTPR